MILPPAAQAAIAGAQLDAFVAHATLDSYIASVVAEEQAAARAAQQAQAAAQRYQPPITAPPVPSSVGGPCGGATNGADQYIPRESGGNPNAENPSGAWGCYQIMPGTWQSSCADLGDEHSADPRTQAQCASRLPLSAWGG